MHAFEAVMLVKSRWRHGNDGMSEYEVYSHFGNPQLSIIDEIGVQVDSEFERVVLTSTMDIRSHNYLPTIVI